MRPCTSSDLAAVSSGDCCSLCHADERLGLHRLRLVTLADGRRARICHGAARTLRAAGALIEAAPDSEADLRGGASALPH